MSLATNLSIGALSNKSRNLLTTTKLLSTMTLPSWSLKNPLMSIKMSTQQICHVAGDFKHDKSSFHIIIAILRTKKEPDCSGTGLMINRERCDNEERKRRARSARRRGREQNQGLTVRLSGDQIRKQIHRMQQRNSRRRRTPGKPGRKGGQIQRIGKKQASRGTAIETRLQWKS